MKYFLMTAINKFWWLRFDETINNYSHGGHLMDKRGFWTNVQESNGYNLGEWGRNYFNSRRFAISVFKKLVNQKFVELPENMSPVRYLEIHHAN